MSGRMRNWIAAAGLVLALLLPGIARADHACNDCPRSTYSCLRYWAPQLYRIHACLHGPKMNTYAPNRHPEIEPSFKAVRFPCPPVDPQLSTVDFYFAR
jgi:hypothetical protein